MRILSKHELKKLVLHSPQHVARLAKAGKIHKRIKLGADRVGFVESEILDWLQLQLELRE